MYSGGGCCGGGNGYGYYGSTNLADASAHQIHHVSQENAAEDDFEDKVEGGYGNGGGGHCPHPSLQLQQSIGFAAE